MSNPAHAPLNLHKSIWMTRMAGAPSCEGVDWSTYFRTPLGKAADPTKESVHTLGLGLGVHKCSFSQVESVHYPFWVQTPTPTPTPLGASRLASGSRTPAHDQSAASWHGKFLSLLITLVFQRVDNLILGNKNSHRQVDEALKHDACVHRVSPRRRRAADLLVT